MDYTEIGNLILDGKWPFITAFLVSCTLLAFQMFYLQPEMKRLKQRLHDQHKQDEMLKLLTDVKATLENSTDSKSVNSEVMAELRISIEEIKALAATMTHMADLTSRLESNLHDFSRSTDDDHRDLIRTIQELHRSIADMNSRLMFVSNSLCSPFPRTDPNGLTTNGIR